MADSYSVRTVGVKEFRRDLERAQKGAGRDVTKALKSAGQPIVVLASALAPRGPSGRLQAGYKASVTGTTGRIVSGVPYSGGAEWGVHGKWSGFGKYGGPGRFAWRAVEQLGPLLAERIYRELHDTVSAHGWFR